jgi:hypothetical protein
LLPQSEFDALVSGFSLEAARIIHQFSAVPAPKLSAEALKCLAKSNKTGQMLTNTTDALHNFLVDCIFTWKIVGEDPLRVKDRIDNNLSMLLTLAIEEGKKHEIGRSDVIKLFGVFLCGKQQITLSS